jgi:Uncharacterised nucleotidyltransferase
VRVNEPARNARDLRTRIALIRMLCRNEHRPRLAMRGTSMVPSLREPMVLELAPPFGRPKIGAIIVFEDGDRLTAHRVVGFSRTGEILAAGDAASDVVEVVAPARIVGSVARIWSSESPGATRIDDPLFRLRGTFRAYRGFAHVVMRAVNPRRRPRAFRVLFDALAAILQGDAAALRRHLAAVDSRRLLGVARLHRCAAILLDGIEGLGVADALDAAVLHALRVERWSAALRAATLRRQVDEIVSLLCRNGMRPILLKGAARVYAAEPGCERHASGDIDFLLPLEQIEGARRVLVEAGYRERENVHLDARHHHLRPLHPPDGGLPVEIHRALARFGTIRRSTEARNLAPWIRSYRGEAGTVGVLEGVGLALHLAIHAREPLTPLRDVVLLAQCLGELTREERDALEAIVDAEGSERLRLHGMLHGAALLAGIEWPAPRAALRYFAWRLRRGDLPTPLRIRSGPVDVVVASGRLRLAELLPTLRPSHRRVRGAGAARLARYLVFAGARIVAALSAGCYAALMREPPS